MWVIDCEDHLKSGIHKKSEPTFSPLKTFDRIGHDESHHFYWLLSNPITCEVGGAFFFSLSLSAVFRCTHTRRQCSRGWFINYGIRTAQPNIINVLETQVCASFRKSQRVPRPTCIVYCVYTQRSGICGMVRTHSASYVCFDLFEFGYTTQSENSSEGTCRGSAYTHPK